MKNTRIQLLKTASVFLVILCICLSQWSCKSSSKLYEKGKYDKAFDKALSNLNKGSKKREDLKILNNSLLKLIDEDEKKIASLLTDDLEKKEKAYDVYGKSIQKYEKANKHFNDGAESRMNLFVNNRDLLADELGNAYLKVAKRNLNEAISNDSKSAAQTAYYQFDKAIYYLGGEQNDIIDQQEQALELGIVYYSVYTRSYGFGFSAKSEIDRVFDDIENDVRDIFKVISYERNPDQTDCSIELYFSDLDQDDRVSAQDRTFDERVITGYNTTVDTSGNTTETPIYETVEATVRINTVRRTSELELRIEVDGNRNDCGIRNQRLDEEFEEELEFYETYGDQRAIPARYRTRNREDFQDPDDIFEDLLEELYSDFRRSFN